MNDRVNLLREKFDSLNIDSMMIMKPENRRYVSGFTGSAGILFITKSEAYLLTDFRYVEQAGQEAEQFQTLKSESKIIDSLKDVIHESNKERIGFEKEYVTYEIYDSLREFLTEEKLVPVEGVVELLRSVKDNDEMGHIERAISIADRSFEYMCSIIRPGLTEYDAAVELEYYMRKLGSQKNSFPPIIASGPRASLPHAQPSNRAIEVGDMVKMDFGATYNGYCSDLTRTVFVGKVSEEQQRVYQIVLSAQEKALAVIAPGKTGIEVDGTARAYIEKNGFGENFGHGLGHGVGLFIHESPRLSQTSTDTLTVGNVVTVEPGIYLPGWGGIRIEDMVLVTKDGCRNLTKANKDVRVL